MKIVLGLELDGIYFEKTVDWPAVPRAGDEIILTEGGWQEPVQYVWWDVTKDGGAGIEFRSKRDGLGEGLADALVRSGWSRGFGDETP